MRAIKIRAVKENRKLKDAMADLLRRGLSQKPAASTKVRKRVKLPLVRCAHGARAGEEITPERAAEILLVEEAEPRDGTVRSIATFGWRWHFPNTFITKFPANG